jgi:hypothetical protein
MPTHYKGLSARISKDDDLISQIEESQQLYSSVEESQGSDSLHPASLPPARELLRTADEPLGDLIERWRLHWVADPETNFVSEP